MKSADDAAFAAQVTDLFARAAREIGDDDAAAEAFLGELIAAFASEAAYEPERFQ